MKQILLYLIAAGLVLAAGAGCMKAGPDYVRPDPGFEMPARFISDVSKHDSVEPNQDRWWQVFGNPGINHAVSLAINANPDILKAAARVMEARAAITQVRADQYPSLNLQAQASRQQQDMVNPFSGDMTSVKTDTFSLSLPASFELDLWGKLSRASQAARADLLAAEENRRTIVQSVIAETVSLYLQVLSLQDQIAVTRELIAAYEQSLDMVEDRYRRGLVSVLDLYQARRSLAMAKSRLPSLIETKGQTQHALAILQGRYPAATDDLNDKKYGFNDLSQVPAGLPSAILEQRPDIRAAEASLEAASARIGVARANRLPQISLTGSFGYTSNELNALLKPASQLWQMAAGGLQPVFDAGKRAAAEKAARARYQQMEAAYASTVLKALAEVEDALFSRRQLIKRRLRLFELLCESEATLAAAEDRYSRGLISYLNVLDARQSKYQAKLDLIAAEYAIYVNRVRLHRALGGGWDMME
jgi:multidrug efflux system outer membrane protein